jgi:hypothetical protein
VKQDRFWDHVSRLHPCLCSKAMLRLLTFSVARELRLTSEGTLTTQRQT